MGELTQASEIESLLIKELCPTEDYPTLELSASLQSTPCHTLVFEPYDGEEPKTVELVRKEQEINRPTFSYVPFDFKDGFKK